MMARGSLDVGTSYCYEFVTAEQQFGKKGGESLNIYYIKAEIYQRVTRVSRNFKVAGTQRVSMVTER